MSHLITAVFTSSSLASKTHFHGAKEMIVCKRQILPIDNVLLLHDNAQPHTSIRTRETTASYGLISLTYLPYSPDLASSASWKRVLRGKYASDEEVKTAVMKRFKEQSISWSRDTCSHSKVEHCYWKKW